ncbi:MAG: hypothetical protein HW403_250 [Dehalococcoidia bacterium]|nr:hypothetical protein [Dehalococcoidia bacterium]
MYVRVTRFKPVVEWRSEVIEMVDTYLAWLKTQPGFVMGMRLFPLHHPEEVARLTVWKDRIYTDHAATTEHSLAVRSHLLAMTVDQVIHEEEFEEDPTHVETEEMIAAAAREAAERGALRITPTAGHEKEEEIVYEHIYELTSSGEVPHEDR